MQLYVWFSTYEDRGLAVLLSVDHPYFGLVIVVIHLGVDFDLVVAV